MKKLYIAPEVEIKRFNTEDIMANSGIEAPVTDNAAAEEIYNNATTNKVDVSYTELFG